MSDLDPLTLLPAEVPLLLSVPHAGRAVPHALMPRLTEAALTGIDTDWHLDRLLNMMPALGVGVVAFQASRLVIDVDQPAGSAALCPMASHGGVPFYLPGQQPQPTEIGQRRASLWQPYHDGVTLALASMQQRFGIAVLLDVHSVRAAHHGGADISLLASQSTAAPSLLGKLTDGVAELTANANLRARVDVQAEPSFALRQHARPTQSIHCLRLNLSQDLYMEEAPPFRFRRDLATRLEPVLIGVIRTILDWARLQSPAIPRRQRAYSPA